MHERYWHLIRRWFWLLILFAVLGAVGGATLLPAVFRGASYDSSTTLGVTPFLSPDAADVADQALLASYAASVAGIAKSPQFISRLQADLAGQGLVYAENELPDKVKVKPDPGLPQVTIEAEADSQHEAELLVREASKLLMEEANARADQVRGDLASAAQQRTGQLISRLTEVYRQREARLRQVGVEHYGIELNTLLRQEPRSFKNIVENIARMSGDAELARLNAEADVLEQELTSAQTDLALQFPGQRQAVFVLEPQETVQTQAGLSLRTLDLMLGGVGGGLVLGWVVANAAEYVRSGRRPFRDPEDPDGDDDGPDPAPQGPPRPPRLDPAPPPPPAPALALAAESGRRTTLVAYPLPGFQEVYQLQKAVRGLPGVLDARIQRFVNQVLELAVDLGAGERLSQRMAELAAFPHRVVTAAPERVEIVLDGAAGGDGEGS